MVDAVVLEATIERCRSSSLLWGTKFKVVIMPTVYTEVEVDVELSDFDTEDLLEELELRGSLPTEGDFDAKEIVNKIYENRRLGKDYQLELNQLIYRVLGRVI